jgi:hypothetical protein
VLLEQLLDPETVDRYRDIVDIPRCSTPILERRTSWNR